MVLPIERWIERIISRTSPKSSLQFCPMTCKELLSSFPCIPCRCRMIWRCRQPSSRFSLCFWICLSFGLVFVFGLIHRSRWLVRTVMFSSILAYLANKPRWWLIARCSRLEKCWPWYCFDRFLQYVLSNGLGFGRRFASLFPPKFLHS